MKKWLLLLVLFIVFGCVKQPNNIATSFYYWKTNFALKPSEKELIKELGVKKLYIRYFDVALKDDIAIPLTAVVFNDSIPDMEIVPVVYIKNEVMLNAKVNLNDLADNVLRYIDQINNKHKINIKEIQFDCDWTLKSKERYFSFIHFIKEKKELKISSTIRLHQIKHHRKTGIPDVDEGVLMYYNMGSIAADSLNSIYDRSIAEKYISSLKTYPLKLNVALPIYSWLIHSRDGKVINLLSRVRREDIETNTAFEKKDKNRFLVKKAGTYFGKFFKQEDQIKIEQIESDDLQQMVRDISKNIPDNPKEIIFYDLEEKNINSYEKEFFKKLVTDF